VPLVKTALGDSDYPLVLAYAGWFRSRACCGGSIFLGSHGEHPGGQEPAAALLPQTHRWFNFCDKMRLLSGEDEMEAERVVSDTEAGRAPDEVARHGDEYARIRASNMLENLVQA